MVPPEGTGMEKREEDISKLGGRSNHFLSPQKADVQLGDLKDSVG